MAGNKDNQKNKTEIRARAADDSPFFDVELLAISLVTSIDEQISLRTRGVESRRTALSQLTDEVTWADQETLFVSWAVPLDRAKSDLCRELQLAGVSLKLDRDREHAHAP